MGRQKKEVIVEEETKEEQDVYLADGSFYDEINWDSVSFQKISKDDYIRTRAKNKKCYGTFLGPSDATAFYMFKPLNWGTYKDIRAKNLDKDTMNEYILNHCVVYPVMDPIEINNIDSGLMLTLVYQIMAVSNFLSDPKKSLDLIYEL